MKIKNIVTLSVFLATTLVVVLFAGYSIFGKQETVVIEREYSKGREAPSNRFVFDNSELLSELSTYEDEIISSGTDIPQATIKTDVVPCMEYKTDWTIKNCIYIVAYSTLDYDICFDIDFAKDPIAMNENSEKGECINSIKGAIRDVVEDNYDAPDKQILTLIKPGLTPQYCQSNLQYGEDIRDCIELSALVNLDSGICEDINQINRSYNIEWEDSCREDVSSLSKMVDPDRIVADEKIDSNEVCISEDVSNEYITIYPNCEESTVKKSQKLYENKKFGYSFSYTSDFVIFEKVFSTESQFYSSAAIDKRKVVFVKPTNESEEVYIVKKDEAEEVFKEHFVNSYFKIIKPSVSLTKESFYLAYGKDLPFKDRMEFSTTTIDTGLEVLKVDAYHTYFPGKMSYLIPSNNNYTILYVQRGDEQEWKDITDSLKILGI